MKPIETLTETHTSEVLILDELYHPSNDYDSKFKGGFCFQLFGSANRECGFDPLFIQSLQHRRIRRTCASAWEQCNNKSGITRSAAFTDLKPSSEPLILTRDIEKRCFR
jgi:hypothetical protein